MTPLALTLIMATQPKLPPMQEVTLLLFKTGTTAQGISKEALNEMQSQHLANFDRLFSERKLPAAGPFEKEGEFRGIAIFDLPKDKVAAEFENDPFVKNGIMKIELYTWMVPQDTFTWVGDGKMKRYIFATVKPGPNRGAKLEPDVRKEEFARHIELNLGLMRSGKASLIGPLTEKNNFAEGIYIFPTEDIEAVKRLVADDPLIKSGYFAFETKALWMADGLFKKLAP